MQPLSDRNPVDTDVKQDTWCTKYILTTYAEAWLQHSIYTRFSIGVLCAGGIPPLKAGINNDSLHSAQMHVHSVSWPSLVHHILQSLYTLQRTICAGLLAWHLAHKTTATIMKRAAPETVTTAMTAFFHFFNPVWP